MTNSDELDIDALEPEFQRIGLSVDEALEALMSGNDPSARRGGAGGINVDVRTLGEVVRSLPDRAGVDAFVQAYGAKIGVRKPPNPPGRAPN